MLASILLTTHTMILAMASLCGVVRIVAQQNRRTIEQRLVRDTMAHLQTRDARVHQHVTKSASMACSSRYMAMLPFEFGKIASFFQGSLSTPAKYHRVIVRLRGEELIDRRYLI